MKRGVSPNGLFQTTVMLGLCRYTIHFSKQLNTAYGIKASEIRKQWQEFKVLDQVCGFNVPKFVNSVATQPTATTSTTARESNPTRNERPEVDNYNSGNMRSAKRRIKQKHNVLRYMIR